MITDNSKIITSILLMAVLNGLGVTGTKNQDAKDYRNLFPPSTQILDVAHYLTETQTNGLRVLTIDTDGRVGSTGFRRTGAGLVKLVYDVLGQALWTSGELRLREYIAENEVPIAETRLTNQSTGTRFHAVVTVLLSKTPRNRHLGKVYLFAEKEHQVSLALTKEYSDSPKIVLDDINADGIPELAVEFVEDTGKAGDVDIWSISATDKLNKIELPDDDYTTFARTYFRHFEEPYHGPGNYTIVATASILEKAIPMEREVRYQWNEKKKSYLITTVTDTREIQKKIPLR